MTKCRNKISSLRAKRSNPIGIATRRFAALAMTVILSSLLIPDLAQAATPADKFVRTAVPYMKTVAPTDYDKLAKFDLVILPAELQVNEPQVFSELRRRNPNIVLLAYFPTKSYITGWGDSLHLAEKSGLDSSWYLLDSTGKNLSVWPGTQALSITTGWNNYLPHFVHDHILSSGMWDGIFYDEVSDTISWANNGNVDLNRDGQPDGATVADSAWKSGMTSMLATARSLDPDKIFVINGTSTPEFQRYINGRMFETFPTPWEANGDWYEIMRRYIANEPLVNQPETMIVNANTANTGNQADYKKMRFALASTLMGNGYYSFDYGDQDHGQTWRYDEYDVALGKATGGPTKATGAAAQANATTGYRFSAGVWERDYQNGIALVNPTNTNQTVTFDSEYEKIRGNQDPTVNNGSIASSVTLAPQDGLVMLRPLDKVTEAPYVNGAFIRVLDQTGTAVRTGFFAYDSRFKGSTNVIETDLTGNGAKETVVTDKNAVKIYGADNSVLASFAPFGPAWKNGMELAVGDVNGDKQKEIIVAGGAGGSPTVKIFNTNGKELKSFLAYAANFRGGVHLAVGNTDGKGADEIVTGAGPGGGPHVRLYDGNGILKTQFYAYASTFRGGVYVAAGDALGLGRAQIIAGSGFGGGPQIRLFDAGNKNQAVGSFFAFNKNLRTGVRVSAADVDGNGKVEILAESTDVFTVTSLAAPTAAENVNNQQPNSKENSNDQNTNSNPTEPTAPSIPDHPLFLGMTF